MFIWIQIIISLLSLLITWLYRKQANHEFLSDAEVDRINNVLARFHDLQAVAVEMGCHEWGRRILGCNGRSCMTAYLRFARGGYYFWFWLFYIPFGWILHGFGEWSEAVGSWWGNGLEGML